MFDQASFIPSETFKFFQDKIRKAAQEKIAPQAAIVDEEEFFNREVESLLWDLELLTLTLPKKYGGYGKGRNLALCWCWGVWAESRAVDCMTSPSQRAIFVRCGRLLSVSYSSSEERSVSRAPLCNR